MHELSRRVRFCINLATTEHDADRGRHNTFAGWPSMHGLGIFYELEVTCRGHPDPTTGYLVNIRDIDSAVRERALPIIDRAVRQSPHQSPADLLPAIHQAIESSLDQEVIEVRWWLTPYYSATMHADSPEVVLLSQRFDFAAAHRLHCDELSAEANREVFGKCNNAQGHGHNYQLDVVVAVPLSAESGRSPLTLPQIERIVDETVIERFDHTNLNADRPEFASLNPSVEHIAKVCYDLLDPPIATAGGRLARVTVWETEKTSCTYDGGSSAAVSVGGEAPRGG